MPPGSEYFYLDDEDPERINPLTTQQLRVMVQARELPDEILVVNEETGETAALRDAVDLKVGLARDREAVRVAQFSRAHHTVALVLLSSIVFSFCIYCYVSNSLGEALRWTALSPTGFVDLLVAYSLYSGNLEDTRWKRMIQVRALVGLFTGTGALIGIFFFPTFFAEGGVKGPVPVLQLIAGLLYAVGLLVVLKDSKGDPERAAFGARLTVAGIVMWMGISLYLTATGETKRTVDNAREVTRQMEELSRQVRRK